MVAKKMYFMDCHLAGRKYHEYIRTLEGIFELEI